MRTVLAAGLVAVAAAPSTASSAVTWTDGNTCTVTAKSPVMVGTSAAGRFEISCTKLSTVLVEVTVGEWDPVRRGSSTVNSFTTPTDPQVALPPTKMYYTPPTINTPYIVTSIYKPCWNSESDYEEYGTKVRIMTDWSLSTAGWSPYSTTRAPSTLNANLNAC